LFQESFFDQGLKYKDMTAPALAVLSALAGAIANLLARKVTRFAPARDYLAVNFGLMFLILLPAAPFFWQLELSLKAAATLTAAALIDLAANYFYFRSFEELDTVTVSSILSLSPAIALFFVPLFHMGQDIPMYGFGGILLVSVGLVILSRGAGRGAGATSIKAARAVWLPLTAALFYGMNVFVIKLLFQNGWTNPFTYYLLRALLIAVIWYVAFRPDHRWLNRGAIWFTAGRLVIVIAQWMMLLGALELGNPAGVKALADSSPLFVLALSSLVTGERIRPGQALGALVILVGMSLVALAGG
jgi:drug/metabolite transporter (DMT)-like permease